MVKKLIQDQVGYDVEIVKISTIGDTDTTSQLHRFRGQGVFTSSLEKSLLDGSVDIAVHSLKDLPVENNDDLDIIAYLKRHNTRDSLIIKESHIISENPLQIKDLTRIATGSPRRQSQILSLNQTISILDIRGNVNTRLSLLETDFIDGLVMAAAVFERLNLDLPKGTKKIELPIETFPTAPGQGVIAVQTRDNEFPELKSINDIDSETSSLNERSVLNTIGGGCQLSLGLNITKYKDSWKINSSITPSNWNLSKELQLSRYQFQGKELFPIIQNLIESLKRSDSVGTQESNILSGKTIVLARDFHDSMPYKDNLEKLGAITASMPVFNFQTDFMKLQDVDVIQSWKEATWVVVTSQRAVEFLDLLNKLHPRKAFRIATIGQVTARKIRSIDLPIHLIANGSLSDLQQLLISARQAHPGRVIFLSGENFTGLPSKDAHQVPVYSAKPKNLKLPFHSDYLVSFSARSAKIIVDQLGTDMTKNWVSIGQSTSKFLFSKNINSLVASSPSPEGVIDAIVQSIR
jgi:hydroxymethylbilane synthase